MSKLRLDLHDVYNQGDAIQSALQDIIEQAITKKVPTVEIIYGKGSGQLKKRVLRFLQAKQISAQYHRLDKDMNNHGRVFIHFKAN